MKKGAYNVDMNSQLPRNKVKKEAGEEPHGAGDDRREQDEEDEQALLALIDHRTKLVETNKSRLIYYTAQVVSFKLIVFEFSCCILSCCFLL